mgnify:FL=1
MDVKKCSKCKAEKPLTEFHNDRNRRDGLNPRCIPCERVRRKARYLAHKDVESARAKNWSANNRERSRANARNWSYNNPGARNAISAKRRAAKLERTVAWGCKESIDYIYNQSTALTKLLGIEFVVDHVYPMQGKLVSGLHVEGNLQIIPAVLNSRKSNKYDIQ